MKRPVAVERYTQHSVRKIFACGHLPHVLSPSNEAPGVVAFPHVREGCHSASLIRKKCMLSPDELSKQLYVRFLRTLAIFVIPVAYLIKLTLGIGAEQAAQALLVGIPLGVLGAIVYPWFLIRKRVFEAAEGRPDDVGNARLSRLFQLPRRIELQGLSGWIFSAAFLAVYATYAFGTSPWGILFVTLLVSAYNMIIGVPVWLQTEELVLPWVRAEFEKDPTLRPEGPKMLLPRIGWHLSLTFTGILLASLFSILTVIIMKARHAIAARDDGGDFVRMQELGTRLSEDAQAFVLELAIPLTLVSGFILSISVWTAWRLGKRYTRATESVNAAIVSLAGGRAIAPDWVGSDEFGDIAMGFSGVLDRLDEVAGALRGSASQLVHSAERLGSASESQNEALTRQSAALQETEVTAQEINQTARLAAQRVDEILKTAERANELGVIGERSIEQTHASLVEIRDEVVDMAGRIQTLGEHARQIDGIATTVKELADQSNMLALNAAIEAVRSGEHGRGFSVVAREIRTLADQSIQATGNVRQILAEVVEAIRVVVAMTDNGSRKVQASIGQAQTSGESLKELSSIVRSNADNMRQISASVAQQSAGITQIFGAVSDLARSMDETVAQVSAADESARLVRQVASDVWDIVERYGLSSSGQTGTEDGQSSAPEPRGMASKVA